MNCERHAASTELCLTISKVEVSLRFPSEIPGSLDSKKKLKRKKKKKTEQKKNATDTNQQLYQKNYHRGLKDKCS